MINELSPPLQAYVDGKSYYQGEFMHITESVVIDSVTWYKGYEVSYDGVYDYTSVWFKESELEFVQGVICMIKEFEEFAKSEGLSLMTWDEGIYASENTQLAWDAFKLSARLRQNTIDDILNTICKHQYSSGDRIMKEVIKVVNNE